MANYTIHTTVHEYARTGDAWNYVKLRSRLIKIHNPVARKSVIVTNRRIDKYFEKKCPFYINENENSLLLDEYYRNRLYVATGEQVELNIRPCKSIFGHLRYLRQHPNDVVRITYWLAIFSILLGLLLTILPLVIQYAC